MSQTAVGQTVGRFAIIEETGRGEQPTEVDFWDLGDQADMVARQRWVALTRLQDSKGNGVSDLDDQADILAVPRSGGDAVPLVTGLFRDGDASWTQ